MEKIGKHNYEAFVLDYMEGNLDEAGIDALFAFLEEHPELKPEFLDEPGQISIEADHISFPEKNELKRSKEEQEEKVIEYIEGLMSPEEKALFEKDLVTSPSLLLLLNDYQKTILAPDPVSFASKNGLKKTLVPEETLIAYTEGVLTPKEQLELETQLKNDRTAAEIVKLYRKTKLEADTSIVYADKKGLKRGGVIVYLSEYRKPLAIAASIVLLFGLFWMFRNGDTEKNVLDETLSDNKKNESIQVLPADSNASDVKNKVNPVLPENASANNLAAVQKVKNSSKKVFAPAVIQNNPIVPEPLPIANNSVKANEPDTSGTSTVNNAIAMVDPDKNKFAFNFYNDNDEVVPQGPKNTPLSTKEYVAKKMKEAAWGEENISQAKDDEKKRLKGFDVLALIGKGLKKLGNKRSDAKKIESADGDGSDYVVTIGGVSVTRHRAN